MWQRSITTRTSKNKLLFPKIVDAREYMDTASRALTDDLTKAYNRRFFSEQMNRLFQQARDEQGSFSLVMFDLDYFKQYNDINGHIQGDIALIETVRILHAVCSLDSAVCRYGGEEFMVLLPGHPLREARRTAENIRQAVYDYRYFNEQGVAGRAAFGVARCYELSPGCRFGATDGGGGRQRHVPGEK
jgi:diguanylate cyclase (GGDEF)-like protein